MEIKIDLAKTQQDLIEILDLQLANHRNYISAEQSNEHGFVTVKHNLELLTEMNKAAPQIIAKANGKVIGYALVMLPAFERRTLAFRPDLGRRQHEVSANPG